METRDIFSTIVIEEHISVDDEDLKLNELIIERHFEKLKEESRNHIITIKKTLLARLNSTLLIAKEKATEEINKKESEIQNLLRKIEEAKAANLESNRIWEEKFNNQKLSSVGTFIKHREAQNLIRYFSSWKASVEAKFHQRRMLNAILIRRQKSILSSYFSHMVRAVYESKIIDEQRIGREKLEFGTKILVERYEMELLELRKQLMETQQVLKLEKARSAQIEEDLRRMFLKNMTVMNMEALSLFQQPVDPPPEAMFEKISSFSAPIPPPQQQQQQQYNSAVKGTDVSSGHRDRGDKLLPSFEPKAMTMTTSLPKPHVIRADQAPHPTQATSSRSSNRTNTSSATQTTSSTSGLLVASGSGFQATSSASSQNPARVIIRGRRGDKNDSNKNNNLFTREAVATVTSSVNMESEDMFPRSVFIPFPVPQEHLSSAPRK